MKHELIDCDCCNKKDIKKSLRVKLPAYFHGNKDYLGAYKMDLCVECANRIANYYYSIASEHGFSGWHGVYEEEHE